jgi:YD repeat-containing protein
MIQKSFVTIIVLSIFYCGLVSLAHAQANSGCTTWVGNGTTLLGGCPPGTITYSVEGPFLVNCEVWGAWCAPQESSCTNCGGVGGGGGGGGNGGGGSNQRHEATAGRPINLATGDAYIRQTDVKIPGLSGGLTLTRAWNSMWPPTQIAFQIGMFGPNWRSTYEERVFVGSDNYIKYSRSNGNFWSFGYSGGTLVLASPANIIATLAQGATYWTLTFQDGEQRRFDNNSGSLIAIIDRNGNTTQLSYDVTNRLITVTDPASRHLTFTYGSPSSRLVTGVSSDVGVNLSYSYDGQGRLSQVTYPDLTTASFTYNSQSLITAVTDSQGKTLESHTYDSNGRGLTSSLALGVEALTVAYH